MLNHRLKIKASIKKRWIICILFVWCLCACGKDKETDTGVSEETSIETEAEKIVKAVKEKDMTALGNMLTGNDNLEISDELSDMFEESEQVDGGVIAKIMEQVTINVKEISDTHITYEISAPDLTNLFNDVMKEDNFTEDSFQDFVYSYIEDADKTEEEIEVAYTYENKVFVADYFTFDFVNCLTGNLVTAYSELMDDVLKEQQEMSVSDNTVSKQNAGGKIELSQYINDFDEFYRVVGGEDNGPTGDGPNEKWFIGNEIEYGRHFESIAVDQINVTGTQYMIFGVSIGMDVADAEKCLEKWAHKKTTSGVNRIEYSDSGRNLWIEHDTSLVTKILFWHDDDPLLKLQQKYNSMNLEPWKTAYMDYIVEKIKGDDYAREAVICKLVNINNDAIPELYLNFGSTAGGDALCSYVNNAFIVQTMWNYGFSYMEGQNLFRESGGHMDVYWDVIYSIENGAFVEKYRGNFGAPDNSNIQYDTTGCPIYNYYWEEVAVSGEEEYQRKLKSVYDVDKANNPYDGANFDHDSVRYVGNGLCDYKEIFEAIAEY